MTHPLSLPTARHGSSLLTTPAGISQHCTLHSHVRFHTIFWDTASSSSFAAAAAAAAAAAFPASPASPASSLVPSPVMSYNTAVLATPLNGSRLLHSLRRCQTTRDILCTGYAKGEGKQFEIQHGRKRTAQRVRSGRLPEPSGESSSASEQSFWSMSTGLHTQTLLC